MDRFFCVLTAIFTIVHGLPLDSEYIVPVKSSDNNEIYVYKGKEYILNSRKVTWLEAKFICRDINGSLAILNNADRAYFFSEALSESNMDIENVWIGAKRDIAYQSDGYEWITREHLPRTIDDTWNLTMDDDINDKPYPLWVNRTSVPLYAKGSNCVAIGHGKQNEPYFVDLQCHLKRQFVCEKEINIKNRIREVGAVVCNDKKFHIFNGGQSWDDAAGYCALNHMRLATVDSIRCVEKIGKKLLRVRPSINNAWIGGRGIKNIWTWLSSGKNINDRFYSKYENDSIESNWPPFRPYTKRKSEGCLLIDRRVCQKPMFTEALCNKKRSFICMDSLLNEQLKSYDEDHQMVIQNQMTWIEANKSCQNINGTLASVTDRASLTKLLLFMAEADEETVQHIWVSGILKDTVSSGKSGRNNPFLEWYDPVRKTYIPGPKDNDSTIPWCDEDISENYNCLNMDRENHLQGLLYGMPCETMQNSICLLNGNIITITNTSQIENNVKVDDYGDFIENILDNNLLTTENPIEVTLKNNTETKTNLSDVKNESNNINDDSRERDVKIFETEDLKSTNFTNKFDVKHSKERHKPDFDTLIPISNNANKSNFEHQGFKSVNAI